MELDSLLSAATQGGLSLVGLLLVLWMIRVLIPKMEARHEREVERLLEESRRERLAHGETINRVITSHEIATERILDRLSEIEQHLTTGR